MITPIFTTQLQTPLGAMLAGASAEGICILEFTDRQTLEAQVRRVTHLLGGEIHAGQSSHLEQLKAELDEYFAGQRRAFRVPLVRPGTAFQQAVWDLLCQIPYGETRTYQQIARQLNRPDSARAVGAANAINPIAIVVPCHRLVGSGGSLTGYGGGIWRKQRLLEFEKSGIIIG